MAETPILPAHIEDTIQAIAKLHAADHAVEITTTVWTERQTGSASRSRSPLWPFWLDCGLPETVSLLLE
jgi:hypothetical protein